MKHLAHLLKWDTILLHRNKLFILAAVMAFLYIGLFFLLKPLGNLTNVLIILIYNDPVVTGYIFAGVMWMFDRNQNTLQAVAVLPVKVEKYLLSKILVLTALSTLVAFIMTITIRGFDFNFLQLFGSVVLSALMFCCMGFIVGAVSKTFNQFLMLSIPVFIITAIPFLPLFGIGKYGYTAFIPSAGGIEILRGAFETQSIFFTFLIWITAVFWALAMWFFAVKIVKSKML